MSVSAKPAAKPVAFVRTLPPRAYFALSLAALLFFLAWSRLALPMEGPLHQTDRVIAQHWREWSDEHPHAWELMVLLTDLGSIATLSMIAVMGVLWQNARHRQVVGAVWLAVMLGGGVLNAGFKLGFNRDRPPVDWRDRAVLESNQSYPSGHTMGSTISYGMLAYGLALQQRRPAQRLVMVAFLFGLVAAIGFSRIYLRAHWFSDVVAGFAVGLAWLSLWLGYLERYRRRRAALVAATAAEQSSEPGA